MRCWKMIWMPFFLRNIRKKKPSQFNQAATICLNGLETQFISRFLADCMNETYYPLTYRNNYQVTARMIHRSILACALAAAPWQTPWDGRKIKSPSWNPSS